MLQIIDVFDLVIYLKNCGLKLFLKIFLGGLEDIFILFMRLFLLINRIMGR